MDVARGPQPERARDLVHRQRAQEDLGLENAGGAAAAPAVMQMDALPVLGSGVEQVLSGSRAIRSDLSGKVLAK